MRIKTLQKVNVESMSNLNVSQGKESFKKETDAITAQMVEWLQANTVNKTITF